MGLSVDLGHAAYLIIFLAVCLESAAFLGFFVPGETLVFLGGFLAAQGTLSLAHLIVLVAIAAILGDCIGYGLGRYLGRAWLARIGHRFGFSSERLQRVDAFFQRHGGKTVFFARFSVLLRVMVPFLAGAARLPFRQFFIYNVLGGTSWATAAVLVGYFAGASWKIAEGWIGRASALIGGLTLLIIAVAWLRHWLVSNESRVKRRWASIRSRPAILALQRRLTPWIAFLQARLTPGGYLGLNLTVAVLIFVGAAWLFGGVVQDVWAGDPLTKVDLQVAAWMTHHGSRSAEHVMRVIHALGSPGLVAALSILVIAYLLSRRWWHSLLAYVLLVPGGLLLNELLKGVFDLVRSEMPNPLTLSSNGAFPAGHANAAVLFYGTLAVLAVHSLARWNHEVSVWLAAALVILLIGVSSVYLRAQFLSSVLTGLAEGLAWLSLCLVVLATLPGSRSGIGRAEFEH